ncbi:hypothetical protein [Methylobacter tundripaludum]|jgi:hypothetical protein|uniref:hypothetical protein n=1 Tax=Methylobacter tundripaludum TaxID=173365 RepID=UPI000690EBDF|nr:hypothetical protein [Methylobacter tundripaludum]MDP1771246.1 hypothetical protein [Methylobacter sp.]
MSILSDALKRLLASDQLLTASALTSSQRKELDQFALSTRQIEILKQGRSTIYRIINRQSVINYLRQLHPLDEDSLPANLPTRSSNIGTDRNSKTGKTGHECCYLLMKAWDSEVVWQDENNTMHVSELTEHFGAAALQISVGHAWQCNRPLLLVENQTLFDRYDWLPVNFNGCLAYYAGQLSDVLLQWLSEQKRTDEVILFPDYDGVGLSNFVRLTNSLHLDTKLHFYWLPDWENKLAIFGNTDIWLKTRVQFENAFEMLSAMNALNADFIRLGSLSQRYGKALEQESIFL